MVTIKADNNEVRQFFEAVEKNYLPLVMEMINRHPELRDAHNCDTPLWRPAHAAAYYGSMSVLEYLKSVGADLYGRDYILWTPLHYAARNNRVEVVKFLIAYMANLECCDSRGATALSVAALHQSFEVMEVLIKAKANPNTRDLMGFTPLMNASQAEDIDLVKLLIKSGACVSAKNFQDNSALHFAAQNCNESMRALIKAGADVNAINCFGLRPLHMVMMSPIQPKHEVGAQILVDAGADVNACDNDGNTALHYAALIGGDVVSVLLKAVAYVDSRNNKLQTSLAYLMSQPDAGLVTSTARLLMKYGASPDARDRWGRSPLHFAALSPKCMKYRAAEELIAAGAEAYSIDLQGSTPHELIPAGAAHPELRRILS